MHFPAPPWLTSRLTSQLSVQRFDEEVQADALGDWQEAPTLQLRLHLRAELPSRRPSGLYVGLVDPTRFTDRTFGQPAREPGNAAAFWYFHPAPLPRDLALDLCCTAASTGPPSPGRPRLSPLHDQRCEPAPRLWRRPAWEALRRFRPSTRPVSLRDRCDDRSLLPSNPSGARGSKVGAALTPRSCTTVSAAVPHHLSCTPPSSHESQPVQHRYRVLPGTRRRCRAS